MGGVRGADGAEEDVVVVVFWCDVWRVGHGEAGSVLLSGLRR